jgi:PAS domain S-box-containing protein
MAVLACGLLLVKCSLLRYSPSCSGIQSQLIGVLGVCATMFSYGTIDTIQRLQGRQEELEEQVGCHTAELRHKNEVLAREITERRLGEVKLKQANVFMKIVLDSMHDALSIIDIHDFRIVAINNSFLRQFHLQEEEVLGKTCYEVTHNLKSPCSLPHHACPLIETRKTGKFHLAEHAHYNRDGKKLYVEVSTAPIRDEHGGIIQVVHLSRDISERKVAEEERRRLATAIEQAAECIIITDAAGTIQYVNPALERISGYTREEVISRNMTVLKNVKNDKKFFRKMMKTLIRGDVWRGRFINNAKDGSQYEVEATVSPVQDTAGTITNYVSVQRDITHEVGLQRQLRQAQKMEAIGTLAAGIAHDFNNILTGICGFTELALTDLSAASPIRTNLEEVLVLGKRAKDLVKRVLTFSRQGEQDYKPMQMNLIVKEALKLLRSSIPSSIDIRHDIPSDFGMTLADPTQMHQIIMNLCTNAYHAMREKGGVLEVSLTRIELGLYDQINNMSLTPGPYLMLTVRDTGTGIEHEILERIFEPYFTTKGNEEGTGLGLSAVHGIVKSHGGEITVSSEPGKGSTFRVYLPLIKDAPDEPGIQCMEPLRRGTERVLIVDDEKHLVRIFEQMLGGLGYHVTSFTNSLEALETFRSQPERFDLILTDLTMPKMTGVELAQKLMAIRPDIPIIVSTGYMEETTREKVMALGVREYLMKPINMSEIAQTVRKVLDEAGENTKKFGVSQCELPHPD